MISVMKTRYWGIKIVIKVYFWSHVRILQNVIENERKKDFLLDIFEFTPPRVEINWVHTEKQREELLKIDNNASKKEHWGGI